MSEQDTSGWGLEEHHSYTDYANTGTSIRVDAEDVMGVWVEFTDESSGITRFTQWIPPEVAEAIGTMLLYAAQKHREEYPDDERE